MQIDYQIAPQELSEKLTNLWTHSANKIKSMNAHLKSGKGSPVVTVNGIYEPRSWTDWTQGFQYGSELFQFDATGDSFFLNIAIDNIKSKMTSHVSHFGVHDHGFNNLALTEIYSDFLMRVRLKMING